jgi:hypothetical protein
MTKNEWEARIGESFQLTHTEHCNLQWDIFPRINVDDRQGKLRGLSSYRLGNLLYLGERLFYAGGIDYKIEVHNRYHEWDTILKSVDHV